MKTTTKLVRLGHKLNLTKNVANHLIGSQHTHIHRKLMGIAIIMIGIVLKLTLTNLFSSEIISYLSEIISNTFHGIGLLPFIMALEKTTV